MKITLSENFRNYQILKCGMLGENSFIIHDLIRDVYSDKLDKLSELPTIIEKYEKAYSDLGKISISEEFSVAICFTLKHNSFHLYQNNSLIKTFDNAFELEKTVNLQTTFDLNLKKLNNGEEIEI